MSALAWFTSIPLVARRSSTTAGTRVAHYRRAALVHTHGNTEVAEDGAALGGVVEDVGELQIAVHDALLLRQAARDDKAAKGEVAPEFLKNISE